MPFNTKQCENKNNSLQLKIGTRIECEGESKIENNTKIFCFKCSSKASLMIFKFFPPLKKIYNFLKENQQGHSKIERKAD